MGFFYRPSVSVNVDLIIVIFVVLSQLKIFLVQDKEDLERMLFLFCCEDGLLLFPLISYTKRID